MLQILFIVLSLNFLYALIHFIDYFTSVALSIYRSDDIYFQVTIKFSCIFFHLVFLGVVLKFILHFFSLCFYTHMVEQYCQDFFSLEFNKKGCIAFLSFLLSFVVIYCCIQHAIYVLICSIYLSYKIRLQQNFLVQIVHFSGRLRYCDPSLKSNLS